MVNNRKSLEKLYTDICTVYGFEKVRNPETKRTGIEPVKKYENIPCRISFKNINSSQEGDSHSTVSQITVLFISHEISIKEGSIIEVTRQGQVLKFESSGIPALYPSHQEIVLKNYKEKA